MVLGTIKGSPRTERRGPPRLVQRPATIAANETPKSPKSPKSLNKISVNLKTLAWDVLRSQCLGNFGASPLALLLIDIAR